MAMGLGLRLETWGYVTAEVMIKLTLTALKIFCRLEGINKEFAGHVTRSNYWHAQLLRAQVRTASREAGSPAYGLARNEQTRAARYGAI